MHRFGHVTVCLLVFASYRGSQFTVVSYISQVSEHFVTALIIFFPPVITSAAAAAAAAAAAVG